MGDAIKITSFLQLIQWSDCPNIKTYYILSVYSRSWPKLSMHSKSTWNELEDMSWAPYSKIGEKSENYHVSFFAKFYLENGWTKA